eukprot:7380640-Prymnesium_polylepis.1
MGFVRRVLGAGAHECFRGVMDNRPGSVHQEWHADGHEWDEALEAGVLAGAQEARRITCFIPLVDLADTSCGATQFFPGSHLVAVDHAASPAWTMPTPDRGAVVAFDYRTIHRGGANTRLFGGATRPMMHIVYARTGYDAKYENPEDRPLFASAGPDAPPAARGADRLAVSTPEALRTVLAKGPDGKVVLVPTGADAETEPYTIAERSVHEMRLTLS